MGLSHIKVRSEVEKLVESTTRPAWISFDLIYDGICTGGSLESCMYITTFCCLLNTIRYIHSTKDFGLGIHSNSRRGLAETLRDLTV